jgi:homoserine dehydrogenase
MQFLQPNSGPVTQFYNLTPNGATNLALVSPTINTQDTEYSSVEVQYATTNGATFSFNVQVSNEGMTFSNIPTTTSPTLPLTVSNSGNAFISIGLVPAPYMRVVTSAPGSGGNVTAGAYVFVDPSITHPV